MFLKTLPKIKYWDFNDLFKNKTNSLRVDINFSLLKITNELEYEFSFSEEVEYGFALVNKDHQKEDTLFLHSNIPLKDQKVGSMSLIVIYPKENLLIKETYIKNILISGWVKRTIISQDKEIKEKRYAVLSGHHLYFFKNEIGTSTNLYDKTPVDVVKNFLINKKKNLFLN